MSLEAALDEERREVMRILEGRPVPIGGSSSALPAQISPAAPVRSMLDIGPPASYTRHVLDTSPVAQFRTPPLPRSMLDPASPPPRRAIHSANASPTTTSIRRSRSDAGKSGRRNERDQLPFPDSQFDMSTTVTGEALPKRVTMGGKKFLGKTVMAPIMQGQELEAIPRGYDRGRHNSTAGLVGMGRKSKSPSARIHRSESPRGSLNSNSLNLMPTPGMFVSETGKTIDLNNAYKKLSNANLLKSGSQLSNVPTGRARPLAGSRESAEDVRLQKDDYDEGEGTAQSSDDERTSDEEAWGSRGRRRNRNKKGSSGGEADNEASEPDDNTQSPRSGESTRPRGPRSLMAAAEEERISVASQFLVRSLLEPTVTVTSPNGEKLANKKTGVHPNTNYNAKISGNHMASDSEDLSDIRRAQRLSITVSPIETSSNRAIRTIIRGEYIQLQRDVEEGLRRSRTYLVATDLSSEAAYALEWTIGTVLREGDTLLAVYAVDEETGTGKTSEDKASTPSPHNEESVQAMQDTAAVVSKLTAAATAKDSSGFSSPVNSVFPYGARFGSNSRAGSTDSRHLSRAEQERKHAIEAISATCIKFLRKTSLSVRIAVEVIHCKNPKYMITEAIDVLEPTLVILGSRGRSALKGVLLGSFSNYLVTKSSVPVMVARRKLQKPHKKDRTPNVRLANNLMPGRSLAEAKVD